MRALEPAWRASTKLPSMLSVWVIFIARRIGDVDLGELRRRRRRRSRASRGATDGAAGSAARAAAGTAAPAGEIDDQPVAAQQQLGVVAGPSRGRGVPTSFGVRRRPRRPRASFPTTVKRVEPSVLTMSGSSTPSSWLFVVEYASAAGDELSPPAAAAEETAPGAASADALGDRGDDGAAQREDRRLRDPMRARQVRLRVAHERRDRKRNARAAHRGGRRRLERRNEATAPPSAATSMTPMSDTRRRLMPTRVAPRARVWGGPKPSPNEDLQCRISVVVRRAAAISAFAGDDPLLTPGRR